MIRNWVPRHALQLLDGVPFKGGVHSSNSNQLILWPNQFPFQAKAVSAAKKADAVRELGGQRGHPCHSSTLTTLRRLVSQWTQDPLLVNTMVANMGIQFGQPTVQHFG